MEFRSTSAEESRVTIRREFAFHIDELKIIAPANRGSTEPRRVDGRLYHPNLAVTHTMLVTLALDDPGMCVNLPLSRKDGRFYIASYVPFMR
jgi:hypothetical protein